MTCALWKRVRSWIRHLELGWVGALQQLSLDSVHHWLPILWEQDQDFPFSKPWDLRIDKILSSSLGFISQQPASWAFGDFSLILLQQEEALAGCCLDSVKACGALGISPGSALPEAWFSRALPGTQERFCARYGVGGRGDSLYPPVLSAALGAATVLSVKGSFGGGGFTLWPGTLRIPSSDENLKDVWVQCPTISEVERNVPRIKVTRVSFFL